MKDRLKFKKASLNRAKEFQSIMKDVSYKTNRVAGDIENLKRNADNVDRLPESKRAPMVKDIFMQMINVLENFEGIAKLANTKPNLATSSLSKTFSKKTDPKSMKMDVVDLALAEENQALKQQIEDLDKKNREVKRLRVNAQKQIFEIEKKLNYIDDEIGEDQQPEVENLEELDLNKEATLTNKRSVQILMSVSLIIFTMFIPVFRTNEILKGLKAKLEGNATGDKYETRLIKELELA
jgi:hypothetical protein